MRAFGPMKLPLSIAAAFAAAIFLTQSARSIVPDHGDYWSDMLLLKAAGNLDRFGFLALRFGVTFDSAPEFGGAPLCYTHWPAFPTLALATMLRLGVGVVAARLFPLCLASSALVALWLMARRITGSRGLATVAALALAAAAPYRLLSDTFCYQSYDFAAKAWTLWAVTAAALGAGSRARALVGAAAGGAATLALCGYEMAAATGLYALLFPLLVAPRGGRLRSLAIPAAVGAGFLAGAALHLSHAAWILGGYGVVLADLRTAYLSRSGGYPGTASAYLQMLYERMVGYYPFHAAVGAVGLVLLGLRGYLGTLPGRLSSAVGSLAVAEAFWFALMREHTNVHPHTADHMAFTWALGIMATAAAVDRLTGGRRPARVVLGAVGVVLFGAAWSDEWTGSAGNLAIKEEWRSYRMEVEDLAGRIPEDGVVLIPNADPPLEHFLRRRTVILRPDLGRARFDGRRRFALVAPRNRFDLWQHSLERFELLHRMEPLWGDWCYDLFDVDGVPGARNAVAWRSRPRQAGARCSDKSRRGRGGYRPVRFRSRSRHADVAREMVEAVAVRGERPPGSPATRLPGAAAGPA